MILPRLNTDAAIRATKSTNKRQEFPMGRGLFLVVKPSGEKAFELRYKHGGRYGRRLLGTYPEMKLADASRESANAKKAIKDGGLVGVEQALAKPLANPSKIVSEAWAEYMTRKWGCAQPGGVEVRRRARWAMFSNNIEPVIGEKYLSEVTDDDLTDLLQAKHDAMVAKGFTGRGINGYRTELSMFFSWCRMEGRGITKLKTNPMDGVPVIARAIARERTPDARELRWTFAALRAAVEFEKPLELVLRTGLRVSNVFNLTKSMIVLEHALGPHLDIPASIMKTDKAFVVPLTQQMLEVLPNLTDFAPNERIWRSSRRTTDGNDGYLSARSLSNPKRRIHGQMVKLASAEGYIDVIEPWTFHDWRRSLSSTMNGELIEPVTMLPLIEEDVVERILAHTIGGVRGIYNRHGYFRQKRHALTLWNNHLDRLAMH